MRTKILAGFLLFTLSGSSLAQQLAFPELSGYKKASNYPVYGPDKLGNYIKGAADTYLAFGFVNLHVTEYKKGKIVIKLEIYRLSNNIMAFGIYSSERSPSFRYMNLGAQGYIADGAINFFKGNYYVKISTNSKIEKVLQSAESLALKVSNMLEGDSKMPAVLSQFPETGKKINEETYINESVLGHEFLNKAFKAAYQVGSDNYSIYIMQNTNSEEVKKTVNAYITSTGMDPIESETGRYLIKDGNNGTIFLAWKDNLIVIIAGLSKDQTEDADRYASEILK